MSLNQLTRNARLRREILASLFVKHCPSFVLSTFAKRSGGMLALAFA